MLLFALLAGVVSWTFAEYCLHRYLGHEHKGKNFFKKEHLIHHGKINYFAPFYKKAIFALIVSLLLVLVLQFIFSLQSTILFVVGFVGMYLLYEFTHFSYHTMHPSRLFIKLRQRHFYHHFNNPNSNYGVTTNFWDRVFGTFVYVNEPVKVPRRMAGSWLLTERYQSYFKLVGK